MGKGLGLQGPGVQACNYQLLVAVLLLPLVAHTLGTYR
jgi:hypothetical protein